MFEQLLTSIFGDPSDKKLKEFTKSISAIHTHEDTFKDYTLDDVKKKTIEFKQKFEGLDFKVEADSIKIKNILNEIKCEAFALVKTTCKLINGKTFNLSNGKTFTWNMIPYDVQLIGGLSIHEGNISEMKTGEGKTLVATLPAYLNSLTGNAVHIVTVNDYLAMRDSEEMGILYNALGLQVGVIFSNQPKPEKKLAYTADVVYATNNELGFDSLRDNMVIRKSDKSQSPLFFCIIDEVDSILIDEARTPLIISMPDNEPTSKYLKFSALTKMLKNGEDYKIDEKQKTALLTEDGIKKVESILKIDNIYVSNHYNDLHHIENALKATSVYIKDKDYLVQNDEVLIIDEHTGRVLSGRRYGEGLHQAIEAKEGVTIQQESKTLASITFQNYFRMYWKLSGMTGTAKTEEEEFYKVYGLDTIVIPTNKPIQRIDEKDLLFKNEKGKFDYVIELIKNLTKTGQPILVGTVSVEKSEYLSSRLTQEGIIHKVLNAKHHEHEAEIVAKAGQKGAITIATNMAGRGTDIKLGEGVTELGGLIILGTEKHETRRIDNQLRGRAGRQGDPGMTQFLISPNDDIMRIFGGDKLFGVFNSPIFASLPDDQPLSQSSMLTGKVTGVQKQVEGHNFDIRKHILEYDDVINKHRTIIYSKRNTILENDDIAREKIHTNIKEMIHDQVSMLISTELGKIKNDDEMNKPLLIKKVNEFLGFQLIDDTIENDDINGIVHQDELISYIAQTATQELDSMKKKSASIDDFYTLEKRIMLQSIDELWMRHIDAMNRLREEVAFEGYAQKNPLVVYKEKAFRKFQTLMGELDYKVVKAIFSVKQFSQVDELSIDDSEIKMNNQELEDIINSLENNKKNKSNPGNTNPLFSNPNTPQPQQKIEKKKIRV